MTCVDCLSPDVSHVFPEFPAPDLGSMPLQESITLHDIKALQLVYRRHCEVTPYSATPNPTCSFLAPSLALCPTGDQSPCPPTGWTFSLGTASACSLLTSKAPLGTSEDPYSCPEHQVHDRASP